MKRTENAAKAKAQVRLLEILERAGWCSRHRAVELIDGIAPTRVDVWLGSSAGNYQGKPDDDFRVTTESGGICDPQRNVGWYSPGEMWTVTHVALGDAVTVDVLDGWATGWAATQWVARVAYSGGGRRDYVGGSTDSGTSSQPLPNPLPSNYYTTGPHFSDYHPNGGFVVEPPPPYPQFYWFAGKDYTQRGATA